MIDLDHITQILLQRSKECFPQCKSWSDSDWMLELIGEAGEACNVVKKMNRKLGDYNLLRDKLAEELSDVLICTLLNAARHRINLEIQMPVKFNLDSVKLGTSIRIDPTQSIREMRVYGLDFQQLSALIQFYRNKTGANNLAALTYEEILAGKNNV